MKKTMTTGMMQLCGRMWRCPMGGCCAGMVPGVLQKRENLMRCDWRRSLFLAGDKEVSRFYFLGGEEMKRHFQSLLRANFRFGRMCCCGEDRN